MSNATFSRKPLVAAVLTTLAVFSAGAMAGNEDQPVNKDVTLTVGTGDNTVSGTVQNEQTWDEARSRSARARTTRPPASSPTNFPA